MPAVAIERVIACTNNDAVITKAAKDFVLPAPVWITSSPLPASMTLLLIRTDDDVIFRRGNDILDPSTVFIAIDYIGITISVDHLA